MIKLTGPNDKDLFCHLLVSCGGTRGAMQAVASKVNASHSLVISDVLGGLVDVPGPIHEIIETCETLNGVIDAAGLVAHFSAMEHLQKMENLAVTVAAELPKDQIPLAHTLLPLTLMGGHYHYANGDALVQISGLVQIGPAVGQPYAHLAGLVWLEGDELWSRTLDNQLVSGVAEYATNFELIDYDQAPKLRNATQDGARQLGFSK